MTPDPASMLTGALLATSLVGLLWHRSWARHEAELDEAWGIVDAFTERCDDLRDQSQRWWRSSRKWRRRCESLAAEAHALRVENARLRAQGEEAS